VIQLKDRLVTIGNSQYRPLMIGGMGVDISTSAMVLEAVRLGCMAHLSDAMVPAVCDKNFGTTFTKNKVANHHRLQKEEFMPDRIPRFDLHEYRLAQTRYVAETVKKKQGTGGIFVNCMEKLQIGSSLEFLGARLKASLDAGADGISLSAGLHTSSMRLMSDHPRFREAKIGIVVSSWRALKLFLRAATRANRLPDYIVVEGPLAGGHLGFGYDWANYSLKEIVLDILHNLEAEGLSIPVIPAGGIFDSDDAAAFLEMGAAAVQVATRFTVAKESGLPDTAKQRFFEAEEQDVFVAPVSPTSYPIRMLYSSPCLNSNIAPQCISLGYAMNAKGQCQYIDAYNATRMSEEGKKLPVVEKICLCHHIGRYDVWTCGSNVVRLKETVTKNAEGIYQQPTTEQIIQEYLGETP
jgi:NAD(P)H-dependent flavin oxidoreductase YrpB (nitropropane dioxygenase family)